MPHLGLCAVVLDPPWLPGADPEELLFVILLPYTRAREAPSPIVTRPNSKTACDRISVLACQGGVLKFWKTGLALGSPFNRVGVRCKERIRLH